MIANLCLLLIAILPWQIANDGLTGGIPGMDLQIAEAWKILPQDNEPVIIAIIDSGVDSARKEIQGTLWHSNSEILNGVDDDNNGFVDDYWGWDFVTVDYRLVAFGEDGGPTDNAPTDFLGHGTQLAGLLTAAGDSSVMGIGREYIKIMAIRCAYLTDFKGYAFHNLDLADAIRYAADNGAGVINLSLSTAEDNQELHDAIKYAYNKDVLIFSSSGNGGNNTQLYPAAYDEVIGVSAIDAMGKVWRGANIGPQVELTGPGVNINVLWKDGGIKNVHGTSYSSVLVAGAAGIIRYANPKLYAHEVRKILRETATDVLKEGRDDASGWGIPNTKAAVEKALSMRK